MKIILGVVTTDYEVLLKYVNKGSLLTHEQVWPSANWCESFRIVDNIVYWWTFDLPISSKAREAVDNYLDRKNFPRNRRHKPMGNEMVDDYTFRNTHGMSRRRFCKSCTTNFPREETSAYRAR